MEVQVTSVARKAQAVGDTAAAVHVVTREDIRRAGLSSIPEALRLVPGLQVARFNAHQWAISARGFNARTANKLLVLIDGRSVYSPLFSGVFWDMHDLPIEDLDRIEVILGPGGTLWGANAVNGIINIVTRGAAETQGVAVELGAGSPETADATVRYGGRLGEAGHFRLYARHREHDEFDLTSGAGADDAWRVARGGFRADLEPSHRDAFTLAGDLQSGRLDQTVKLASIAPPGQFPTADTLDTRGAHLLGRWLRDHQSGAQTTVQTYWDHVRREEAVAEQRVNVFDIDVQHRLAPLGAHEITWGFGYRLSAIDLDGSFTISLSDTERHDQVLSAFVHDRIRLRDDLALSLGSKLEHNDFTGFEAQPSARLAWNVTERHSVWAAATRAVRTPTPSETTLRFNQTALPGAPPRLISFFGEDELGSEKVAAFEIGFRGEVLPRVSLDVAAFYNRYEDLISTRAGTPRLEPGPRVLVPFRFGNLIDGETFGLEAVANWRPVERWSLRAAYTWLEVDVHGKTASAGGVELAEGSDPEQQVQLHSRLDLRHDLAFDASLYWVDRLQAFDLPSYTRLDLRLAWRPTPGLEASVGALNVLDDRHAEFGDASDTVLASEVPRAFYGRLVWRW